MFGNVFISFDTHFYCVKNKNDFSHKKQVFNYPTQ